MITTVGFVGLGLIGGSIAKALKKNTPDIYIIAASRSRKPLMTAHQEGIIDEITEDIKTSFSRCDIIFLCTPVELISGYLQQIAGIIKPSCIITDVGSVKGYIHDIVRRLNLNRNFIGGHPMAGSEKTGYSASNELLLQNAYYAITPTEDTSPDSLAFFESLVKSIGAIPIICNPAEHDYAVAGISHVPHIIASSLVNMVQKSDTDDELMKTLAAGGFKDITRIASSSAEVWSQICSTNREQILKLLDIYIQELSRIRNNIYENNSDEIYHMFCNSKEYRDSIGLNRGTFPFGYNLYLDIEDREGALNKVTGLLSSNHINIKNMEIIHNREFVNGVLSLSFYDDSSRTRAIKILSEEKYIIHR